MKINVLTNKIINGYLVNKEDLLELYKMNDVDLILKGAKKIKNSLLKREFKFCSIINAEATPCSEDCKFCSQSVHYNTEAMSHKLLDYDKIYSQAKSNEEAGIKSFSLVATGKKLNNKDFEKALSYIKRLKSELSIKICASFGILNRDELRKLKEAGIDCYHHNLETSRDHYKNICTTHSFESRINTIKNARKLGIRICSGGIIGINESLNDFINMALELRDLDVQSIPINILMPIKGTPMENKNILDLNDIIKKIAILRYTLPNKTIVLGAGRLALKDNILKIIDCIVDGSITGDLLTTTGGDIKSDFEMIKKADY